jgi:predicted metal-binding membrane protein
MAMLEQTWWETAASFLGMWIVMMAVMMLPSLVPMLWRYREAVGTTGRGGLGRLTALVALGYFLIWILCGMVAFPLGAALARGGAIATRLVVLFAGALQFTKWKAHHLACCREAPGHGHALQANLRTAWLHGLRLGLHCLCCSAGMTAVLLVIGVMDLRVMAVVTAATTVERLAPTGERVARMIGGIVIAAGVYGLFHSFSQH